MQYKTFILLTIIVFSITWFAACSGQSELDFSGENALQYIEMQLDLGYRIPGSAGSKATQDFLETELEIFGWIIERQSFSFKNVDMVNIVAKSSQNSPKYIFGTHYDSRRFSDQDPLGGNRTKPVPGANDSASGTAVLLEFAKLINKDHHDVWIIFFDGEDQGYIDDWYWSIGAEYFASKLDVTPEAVIVIDMIGDSDLSIYKEHNSTNSLTESLWQTAADLGYSSSFHDSYKYTVFDDHVPFLNKNIPACLLIDLDYPYWHTTEDTIDKVSSQSLEIVGKTLLTWLRDQ